jgi:FkbM family methyltransferase
MEFFLKLLRRVTRLFYKVRGLARVADFVRRSFAGKPREIVIGDFDGGLKMSLDIGEHIGSWIFWKGNHSLEELEALAPLLREDSVFFDMGANQGEFSLFAAKRLPKGRVFAFEPVARTRSRLERNVALNALSNVTVLPYGLAAKPGRLPIHLPKDNWFDGSLNMGAPSIYGEGELTEEIEIRTLDGVFAELGAGRIDVLKADIEGAEYDMLKGGAETLRKHRPVMLLEANSPMLRRAGSGPREFCGFLRSLGYSLTEIVPGGAPRPLESDDFEFKNLICLPAPRGA